MIRRRSTQKGKETRREGDAPEPFFNFADDATPADDGPLFNLEELHERRILSWSPDPDEFLDDAPQGERQATRAEREEVARSAYDPPVAVEERVEPRPQATVTAAPAPERVVAPPPPPQVVSRPVAPPPTSTVAAPAPPLREVAPPAPAVKPAPVEVEPEADAEEIDPVTTPAPKRRGRPRGRPRRQVHFHVDPDEERLLMLAVERYGSQQKGLIAALESLQENDLLRDEIERLRAETARHRKLLDEAESLFNR